MKNRQFLATSTSQSALLKLWNTRWGNMSAMDPHITARAWETQHRLYKKGLWLSVPAFLLFWIFYTVSIRSAPNNLSTQLWFMVKITFTPSLIFAIGFTLSCLYQRSDYGTHVINLSRLLRIEIEILLAMDEEQIRSVSRDFKEHYMLEDEDAKLFDAFGL